ncbi:outer membrane lipoprotein carrier protein LolA [bacterium]|nr:MAG: outer membrane lipoprotein carrier protein LolA [bacterium]
MNRLFLLPFFLLIFSVTVSAQNTSDDAASAMELVNRTYKTLTTIKAHFVQTEERPGVGISNREEGTLSFLLPDRMRWDYLGSKPHKVIIDGSLVWIYMPTRHQVVRKEMTREEMRQGAATFLSGLDGLEDEFTVQSGNIRPGGRYSLDLFPVSVKTPYDRIGILVAPDTGIIERISIHHRIGNITTITFSEIETNAPLPKELFQWDVPEGTEVIEP